MEGKSLPLETPLNLDPRWLSHEPNATPSAEDRDAAMRVHILGLEGVVGTPGPRGKSAYQEWLDKGNKGTEKDFLDSLKGDTGERGEEGEPGTRGPAGQSVAVKGSVETVDDLPTNLTEADAGELWITTKAGHAHYWTGTEWTDVGKVVGPEGQPGPRGEKGIPGPGVPTGGAQGQVLVKASGSDYDTEWSSHRGEDKIVSEGNLEPAGSSVSLIINNVVLTIEATTETIHGLSVSTITGEEVIDFRFGGIVDYQVAQYYTMNETRITTIPVMRDSKILDGSRNPIDFWLRENGRLWKGGTFVSGLRGTRATMWANRIV